MLGGGWEEVGRKVGEGWEEAGRKAGRMLGWVGWGGGSWYRSWNLRGVQSRILKSWVATASTNILTARPATDHRSPDVGHSRPADLYLWWPRIP